MNKTVVAVATALWAISMMEKTPAEADRPQAVAITFVKIALVRKTMPRISAEEEFEQLPLRVHAFLADVPLPDVWSVNLPRWRAGITLDEF